MATKRKPVKKKPTSTTEILRQSTHVLSVCLIAFSGASLVAPSAHAQNPGATPTHNFISDPALMKAFQAQAVAVSGQVTGLRDDRPWALSSGDLVPVQQTLTTGRDGYAQLRIPGGSTFEILENTQVVFRQNVANPNDVMDVLAGRVRMQLRPKRGEQQRIFSPSAIITAHVPASLALAIDEDDTVRIDVIEGEIRVQHSRLPANEAVLVRAIDAILVSRDQAISRRVDRGMLYRYTARILTAITFGHAGHDAEPIEGNKLLPDCPPLRVSF